MKKLLALAFLLASCTTTKEVVKEKPGPDLQPAVEKLANDITRLEYYIAHDKCFTSYAVCMVDKKKNCWSMHEQCVIAVYKQYKPFLK